ncbi:hypothetical protein [Streptomyces drozdowiczii]|uniref:hypothetical protein n=1 Tax=Streptomyces drozdowiczii TaxID=202862 RepID=UPI00403D2605
MTDRDQLHHLANRARRGVLLPEEGALLADAITALEQQLTDQASSDDVARRAAQAIAGMGADIRAIRAERDRYRNAWKSARHRAAPTPGTVTITQARHQHLVAGQCTDRHDTHRLHHTEPVTGCPYPGCHPDA